MPDPNDDLPQEVKEHIAALEKTPAPAPEENYIDVLSRRIGDKCGMTSRKRFNAGGRSS